MPTPLSQFPDVTTDESQSPAESRTPNSAMSTSNLEVGGLKANIAMDEDWTKNKEANKCKEKENFLLVFFSTSPDS